MTHTSLRTLKSVQVGDYMVPSILESYSDEWMRELAARNLHVECTDDDLLIVVGSK